MQLLYPVPPDSVVTQTFAAHVHRARVNNWQHYNGGIDWAVPTGTPIRAAQAGRVIVAMHDAAGYGVCVRIQHDEEHETLYAHLMDCSVVPDQTVEAGDVIGRSDSTGNATGPHLHFELRQNGEPIDPGFFLVTQLTSETLDEGTRDLEMAEASRQAAREPRRWPKLPRLQVVSPVGISISMGPGSDYPAVGYLPRDTDFEAQRKIILGDDTWLQIGYGQYVPLVLNGEVYAAWI